jgi:UPF0042 nucleotide-binding protein
MKPLKVVIISGISGSGKSTAIKALEDIGFFCVDNLPVTLLPTFIELCEGSSEEILRIAVGMDIRERAFLKDGPSILERLKGEGRRLELIFLEATDESLIKRYSETRRQHPFAQSGSLLDGIRGEREELSQVKDLADLVIDTSDLNVHHLRQLILQHFSHVSIEKRMSITLLSFGYRFGIPHDADLVIDVRFLPNPYFVEELKYLGGTDPRVVDYVLKWECTQQFLKQFKDLLDFLIPLYVQEGKTYLTIAFGCTGGRHRSVAVVTCLENMVDKERYSIRVGHRDLRKR